jgi:serine/threonine-protein kinase HipA
LREIDVWIEGVDYPIGRLAEAYAGSSSIFFAYTDDWLALPGAFAISFSLPLEDGAYDDRITRNFFQNMLQENDQLSQIIRREGLNRDDILGILRIVGAECAGALSCLPKGSPPVKRPGNLSTDYDVLDDATVADFVKRLAAGRSLPEELRDPSPVAGFRQKFSLAKTQEGRFAIPKPGLGVPTTHILKIPDPDHPGEAVQEAAAAQLARECGFEAANSVALKIAGGEQLLIERFDRTIGLDGSVTRIHQEDFAQALALPHDFKYERRANGLYKFDAIAIAGILNKTAFPARARDMFLRMTLFNLMIGNSDNHAKNHAFLFQFGGPPVLAPLYDLVPIPLGEGYTDELAFNIGNAKRARDLKLDDLLLFYAAMEIPKGRAERVLISHVRALVEQLEVASTGLADSLRSFDMLIGREMARLLDLTGVDKVLRERDYLPETEERAGWALS